MVTDSTGGRRCPAVSRHEPMGVVCAQKVAINNLHMQQRHFCQLANVRMAIFLIQRCVLLLWHLYLQVAVHAGTLVKYSEIFLGIKYRVQNEQNSYDGGPITFSKSF